MSSTRENRIATALELAASDAQGITRDPIEVGPFTTRVAVGDAQCPFATYLEVLDRHGLLSDEGTLKPHVWMVSIGDHFDWGGLDQVKEAARQGWHLLAWLAAHPPEQVVILAGNHDLARVGELANMNRARHQKVLQAASKIYKDGETDPVLEPEFLSDFPEYPSAQVAARDLSAFREEQQQLVVQLLRQRRIRAAEPLGRHTVALHAGVTMDFLRYLDLDPSHCGIADAVAATLNRALAAASDAWSGGPMAIEGMHRPGSAAQGEGGGLFYHRPAHPSRVPDDEILLGDLGPDAPPVLRRVFDARRLPLKLTQVVGHVRDYRCRDLLEDWVVPAEAVDGPLRHLSCDGETGKYQIGIPSQRAPEQAHMIFLDSGMNYTDPANIEILDVETMAPYSKPTP